MYIGKISSDSPRGNPALRVAYGKHWAIGGDVAADSMGEFQVPSSALAIVAYIDANDNGQFDRFAEPSGDCHLVRHEWNCSILYRKTTLHRAITTRNDEHHDSTYVFWEDFRPDGTRTENSYLCIEHRCTNLDSGPFLSRPDAQVQKLSICEKEGFAPQNAELRAPGGKSTVPIAQPAKFDVSIDIEQPNQLNEELRLHIMTSAIDRVLIWGGRVNSKTGDIKNIYWSSEDAHIRVTDSQQGIEVGIPLTEVRLCQRDPDCEIVVQLLKYWSSPATPIVSATEYRSAVNFRGRP